MQQFLSPQEARQKTEEANNIIESARRRAEDQGAETRYGLARKSAIAVIGTIAAAGSFVGLSQHISDDAPTQDPGVKITNDIQQRQLQDEVTSDLAERQVGQMPDSEQPRQ